jgi:hypothetical protein
METSHYNCEYVPYSVTILSAQVDCCDVEHLLRLKIRKNVITYDEDDELSVELD